MPRSKPDNVTVHRLELGHWERERLKKAELVTTGALLLPAAGIAVAGVGAGLAGYALYQWLKDGLFVELNEQWDDFKESYANRPQMDYSGYQPSDDPTGENRGFLELTWDSLVNAFANPWWSSDIEYPE